MRATSALPFLMSTWSRGSLGDVAYVVSVGGMFSSARRHWEIVWKGFWESRSLARTYLRCVCSIFGLNVQLATSSRFFLLCSSLTQWTSLLALLNSDSKTSLPAFRAVHICLVFLFRIGAKTRAYSSFFFYCFWHRSESSLCCIIDLLLVMSFRSSVGDILGKSCRMCRWYNMPRRCYEDSYSVKGRWWVKRY